MRRVLIAVGVLAAVFLAGYLPQQQNARKARRETARLELELSLARLQGKLGMMSYEASRNNFANAAALSSEFFDGLRESLVNPVLAGDASRKAKLAAVAARRDQVIADLARADPAVKDTLVGMYVELSEALAER
jgi:hypothetical protein